LNRCPLLYSFLCALTVFLFSGLPLFAYETSGKGDRFSVILCETGKAYPSTIRGTTLIDRKWNPGKSLSVLWICSKKYHTLLGVDTKKGVLFFSCDIATGRNNGQKRKVGDMRTPEGKFSVSQIQDASWWQPYHDKATGDKIGYGPFFIRLDAASWKGIGIHGTDRSHVSEIGTNASHGCLRLRNEDLLEVVRYCTAGQTVIILP